MRSRPPSALLALALLALLPLAALVAGCKADNAEPAATGVEPPAGAPRLILLLVVDQGAEARIERLRPLLHSGLARLLRESAWFMDAHQEHAPTETAPGHATLATGRYPSHHGVVANEWTDPETGRAEYCVDDEDLDRSPRNLLSDTIGDWIHDAVPGSKVYAASGKDRSAILLGGHNADGAFWYDRANGRFKTSAYYPAASARPAWREEFRAGELPAARFGNPWEPLPAVAAAAEMLAPERPDLGPLEPWYGFPHVLGGMTPAPDAEYFAAFYGTPFLDEYLERFAAALIAGEDLGSDAAPDLLALSFSALDSVGHTYGPDSLEYADTLVRLDRTLGELLDVVDREVGLEHTLVVLSADHGITSAPEVLARRGAPGARMGRQELVCTQGLEAELGRRFGDGPWLATGSFLRAQALAAHGLERATVEAAARDYLEGCPGVARVWTRSELTGGTPPGDATARLFANAFHPGRSPDLLLQLDEGFLAAPLPLAASHLSPYPENTHVPWLVRGSGIRAREIGDRVETVDVAPTIAGLAGIPIPPDVDGVDRSDDLRTP